MLTFLLVLGLFLLRNRYVVDVVWIHEVLVKGRVSLKAKLGVRHAHKVGVGNGNRNELAVLILLLRRSRIAIVVIVLVSIVG